MTQTDPRALVNLARQAELRGDVARSLQLYDDALTLLGDQRDLQFLADALRWKGTLHREQGETEAAYRCYTQSLIHAETCGSVNCRAHVHNCLAIVARAGAISPNPKGSTRWRSSSRPKAVMCGCSE